MNNINLNQYGWSECLDGFQKLAPTIKELEMNQVDPMDLKQQIKAILGLYRGLLLDAVESEYGDNQVSWRFVRGRLLKLLGDRGLEAALLKIAEYGGTGNKDTA